MSNLGPLGQISYFNHKETKVLGPPFEPSTSAQLARSASVLPRVSPLTPTRCYPVALGFKPREFMSNLGPPGQISYFNRIEAKNLGFAVRALDLGPTSGKTSVLPRVSPLTPTRCNPVVSGFIRVELVTPGKISYFNCIQAKVLGPPFKPSTSAKLAGRTSVLPRVSPLTPTRCNPVALGFKPRESVSNLGPPGQISFFNHIEAKVLGSAIRALDLRPTSRKCQYASKGVPSNAY